MDTKNPTKNVPENKEKPKTTTFAKIVAGSVFLIVILSVFLDPAPTQPTIETPDKYSAIAVSEGYILQNLKSPSSAEFCRADASDLGNNKYQINSCVDSQNSFGATVRSNWSVTISYIGGSPISNSSWRVESANIDGNKI